VRRPLWPHHLLAYALSLPERVLRAVAVLVGLVLLGLTRAVPGPLRRGKFFRLAVARQIKMLTDDVGLAGVFPGQAAVDRQAATRLAVGGALDNLMVIGLHASPLWILLAASDVSAGARAYMRALGEELKAAGVMGEGSRLDSLEDVLAGLHRFSDRLSDTVDMPPLSLQAMRATVQGLGAEMRAGGTALWKTADLDGAARDLTALAREGDRSLLETTGAMALGSVRTAGQVLKGGLVTAGTTLRFVGKVVWHDVLGDWRRTLADIRRRGLRGAVRGFLRPQSRSWRNLFAFRFLSVTELLLSLGTWRRAAWRRAARGGMSGRCQASRLGAGSGWPIAGVDAADGEPSWPGSWSSMTSPRCAGR
jgi:hypothetical protein